MSPCLTRAPSSTDTSTTRAVRVLPTSTRDAVATRAENCRVRSSGALCTVSAGAVAGRPSHQANAAAARAAMAAICRVDLRGIGISRLLHRALAARAFSGGSGARR